MSAQEYWDHGKIGALDSVAWIMPFDGAGVVFFRSTVPIWAMISGLRADSGTVGKE